jgi:hypothetical protein
MTIYLRPTGSAYSDTENLEKALEKDKNIVLENDVTSTMPFFINKPINIFGNGINLSGINPIATTVNLVNSFDNVQPTQFFNVRGQYNSIRNLKISGEDNHYNKNITAIALNDNGTVEADATLTSLENLFITHMGCAVVMRGGAENLLQHVHVRNITSDVGIKIIGNSKIKNYRPKIFNLVCDIDRPFINSMGPTWIKFYEYSDSLVIQNASLMNGLCGIEMGQENEDVGDNYPKWVIADDIETDHCLQAGICLSSGEGFYASNCWFGSTLYGPGLKTDKKFRGELSLSVTRVMGNAMHGIALMSGQDIILTNVICGDNSAVTKETVYSGIALQNVSKVKMIGVKSGDAIGVGGNKQAYGLLLKKTVKDVEAVACDFSGNSVGAIGGDYYRIGRWMNNIKIKK